MTVYRLQNDAMDVWVVVHHGTIVSATPRVHSFIRGPFYRLVDWMKRREGFYSEKVQCHYSR